MEWCRPVSDPDVASSASVVDCSHQLPGHVSDHPAGLPVFNPSHRDMLLGDQGRRSSQRGSCVAMGRSRGGEAVVVDRRPEAPPKAQAIGEQAISLSTNSSHTSLQPAHEPLPVQRVNIPARSLQSGTISLPGALEGSELPTLSQGPGTGDGVGAGRGPGLGEGEGPGLGPGGGGNRGGRFYRPGTGVTPPIASHQQRPSYTSDAVRARIQGVVLVECIVHVNGACSDVHVVRSLDTRFGLDQEAIKAARMWRFVPGTLMGQPVPVIVTIELTFGLH